MLNDKTVVDAAANELTFAKAHKFSDGDIVSYRSTLGDVGGLTENTFYTVNRISDFTIQLENASGTVVDLSATADWSNSDSALSFEKLA